MRRSLAIALSSLLLVACGSNPAPNRSATGLSESRNYISFEEIKANRTPGSNAWDLIAHLRPNFLRTRGTTSFRDLSQVSAIVYLDGVWYGKIESLKSLNIEEIREIEFLSPGDATTRFGTDHLGGAILIHTR
jgi:hypothetical protein